MKKPFLKRAIAAAVAVPVALTQNVMFASFAAGEETGSENKVIGKDTFLSIPVDTVPTTDGFAILGAPEANNEFAIIQKSNWASDVRAALTAMYDEEVTLNPAKVADSISSTAWYSEFLKNALRAEGTVVTAKILSDDVVITIDVDYNYGNDAAKRITRGRKEYQQAVIDNMNSKAVVKGQIVITADVADIDEVNAVPMTMTVKLDGLKDGKLTDTIIPYVQSMWDTTKAEMEAAFKAAGLDEKAYVSQYGHYQDLIQTAQNAIDKAGKTCSYASKEKEFADIEELWTKAREESVDRSGRFERLPETFEAAQDTNAYACAAEIFDQVVEKINEKAAKKADCEYRLSATLDDVVDIAYDLYDLSATADSYKYVYDGTVLGYLPDDEFDASAYEENLKELVEAEKGEEGKEVKITKINSVKVLEAAAAEVTTDKNLVGSVALDIYRVVWPEYEIVDVEETEPSETEPSETEPSETEPTAPTDETEPTAPTDETEPTAPTDETEPTAPTGETEPTEPTGDTDIPARHDVKVNLEAGGFYFSHDPRLFSEQNLIKSATIEENGVERAITEKEMEKFTFSFRRNATYAEAQPNGDDVSPKTAYADKSLNPAGSYFGQSLYVYYEGELVADASATVFIGVKGDVNNDGVCNASDAAKILIYAAAIGAAQKDVVLYSQDNETLEHLAYFLGDTNGESVDYGKTTSYDASIESPLNASDAAQVLIYAAAGGASKTGTANWIPEAIKSKPYPKYSEEIYNYMVAKGMVTAPEA